MKHSLLFTLLILLSPLSHSALIEWDYNLFQHESNFSSWSGFSDGDKFGFGFAEDTNFSAIAETDLMSIYYVINGVKYESGSIFNMRQQAFTSRFTFDGTLLSYHDVFSAPIDGNGLGGNDWQWIRSTNAGDGDDQIWMASGVNTTFYAVIDGVAHRSNAHVNGNQRHDIYTGTSTTMEVPEPSTLAIFALGMIGLASRRLKKQ